MTINELEDQSSLSALAVLPALREIEFINMAEIDLSALRNEGIVINVPPQATVHNADALPPGSTLRRHEHSRRNNERIRKNVRNRYGY